MEYSTLEGKVFVKAEAEAPDDGEEAFLFPAVFNSLLILGGYSLEKERRETMGPNKKGKGTNQTARLIALILFIIFFGPVLISILGSVVVGLFTIALLLLAAALVLLASPILIMVFPASAGFNIPQLALFFFGIAVLAVFVLVTAVVIRIIKWILFTIWTVFKRMLG